jgi:hypothetical protein
MGYSPSPVFLEHRVLDAGMPGGFQRFTAEDAEVRSRSGFEYQL